VAVMVTVLDASDTPLSHALVTVAGRQGVTDSRGRVALPDPAGDTFAVTAEHPDHLSADFTVSVVGVSYLWNVPGHEVTGSPGAAVVTVRLGRLDAAPIVRVGLGSMAMDAAASTEVDRGLAEDQVAFERARAKDPNASMVHRSLWRLKRAMSGVATDTSSDRYWHEFVDTELDIHVAVHPLLKAPDATGWDKLHHAVHKQLLATRGDLYWVEWGVAPRARYLVAVWCPQELTRRDVREADVAVFYTPPIPLAAGFLDDRSPFRADYPYTANPSLLTFLREDSPPPSAPAVHHWMQRYVELGHRYLLREGGRVSATQSAIYGQWLIHQLAAAPRRALLVLPIQTPQAPWPPTTGPGLARLLQEVLLWLYRDGRIGMFGTPGRRPGAIASALPMSRHSAPPKLGELAAAGFSSGWSRTVQAATGSRRPADSLYEAGTTNLDTAWRQLWCLDAPRRDGWSPAKLMATLNAWASQDASHRTVRVYQTSYTGWNATDARAHYTLLGKAGTLEVRDGAGVIRGLVRHRPDARATLVWFDDHLRGAPPSTTQFPNFYNEGDIHQVVPKIAFGHAASLWV
jgi:hypothetical protein